MSSSLALVTRWNTSCCGMEPMASVAHAATKAHHSLLPPVGQNWNLPASAACCSTVPKPPAMPESEEGHVDEARPR